VSVADEVVSWVDPDGAVTPLSDQGSARVSYELGGRFMPPVSFIEDDVPRQDGARLREVRVAPREVVVPIAVVGADQTEVRTTLRSLMRAFNPKRGNGKLRVTAPDGTVRDLTCRYSQGLEIEEKFEKFVGWQRAVVVLRAVDPYWYDTAATSTTYTVETPEPFFPIFPLKLNSDTVLGTQTIDNTGDVEAFPVWTVHGPCTSITLSNSTTGQTIDLPVALTAAQTVTIDTRPFRKTVSRDDGTNLYGSLSTSSSLWVLPVGLSTIVAELPGATVDSYVTLTYSRRWLSP
jgi:phage-related protein